jgi:hypothetical protein
LLPACFAVLFAVLFAVRSRDKIAQKIDGRSAKQCRERWTNFLNPNIKKGPFSGEEDCILIEQWKLFGPRWAVIADQLPGRTQIKIRDRFKTLRTRHCEELDRWKNTQNPELVTSSDFSLEREALEPLECSLSPLISLQAPQAPALPKIFNQETDDSQYTQHQYDQQQATFQIKRVGSLDCLLDVNLEGSLPPPNRVDCLGGPFNLDVGDICASAFAAEPGAEHCGA